MNMDSNLTVLFILVSLLVSVVSALQYNVVVDINSCNESPCVTLSTVVNNPDAYFTSDSTLTFLPGTHVLDHNGPILISDVSNLTLQGNGEVEDGFHWTIKQTNVFITCTNSTGGFVFNRSSVHIEGLTITGCGTTGYNDFLVEALQLYTNGLYSDSFHVTIYWEIGTVLFFIDCPSVRLGSYLSVQNCSGNCLTFFNTHSIDMYHVYIAHNSPERYKTMDCCDADPATRQPCVGGGAFFYYLDTPECKGGDPFNVTIEQSVFAFAAGSGTVRTTVSGITVFNLMIPTLTVHVNSVLLYNNNGGNFGAVSSYSDFQFYNITSSMANVNYIQTCPLKDIGITFKFSISNELACQVKKESFSGQHYTSASVYIKESLFEDNVGINSAGINIDTTFVVDFLPVEAILNYTVENTVIHRNHAPIASCIGSGGFVAYPARLYVQLRNLKMVNNFLLTSVNIDYVGIPPSCVVLVFTSQLEMENVLISDQPLVGILGLSSNLRFSGNNVFRNNTGVSVGGAISLGSNCKFVMNAGSNVSFIDNQAQFGAAIAMFSSQAVSLVYQLCAIQFIGFGDSTVPQSYLNFIGNRANVTGNVVFGGNLDNCLLFTQDEVVPIKDRIHDIFIIHDDDPVYNYFQFSSKPLKVCFCDGNSSFECNRTDLVSAPVYAGQYVEFNIANVGEIDGFSVGAILIKADFLNYTYESIIDITDPACTGISLSIKKPSSNDFVSPFPSNNFSISFNVSQDPSESIVDPVIVKVIVPVKDCPPGFVVNSSFICECNDFLKRKNVNVECNIADNTISHELDVWIGYDNTSSSVIYNGLCPFDYCVHSSVTFNLINSPDDQCAYNRAGILCGRCAEGYSLLLGSNECGKCPNNNYLSLLLVFGAAGIVLVIFLILLNLTVSVGTINGLIFYANFVKINESVFFPNGHIPVLSNFISVINLDFGIQTCFYHGMTPYDKVWLQFLFPLYLWILIIVIILLCKWSAKLSQLAGSHSVPVLATLLILSFTKLTRTVVLAFGQSHIQYEDGGYQTVWTVDGNLVYYGPRHSLLNFAAVFIFVIVLLPITVFVTFVPLRHRIISSLNCLSFLSSKFNDRWPGFALRLKPLSDAYSGQFEDMKGYWLGLGLVARLIIASTVPFVDRTSTVHVMFMIVVLYLSLFAILKGTYRLHFINVLEVWSLLNLLTVTFFGLEGNEENMIICTKISVSLMLITFCGIVAGHTFWRIKKHPRFNKAANVIVYKVGKRVSIDHSGVNLQIDESLESSVEHYREPLLED